MDSSPVRLYALQGRGLKQTMVISMFEKNRNSQDKPQAASEPAGTAPSKAEQPRAGGGSSAQATIGATVRVKGDVTGEEDLTVEGQIEGTVVLDSHELVIGQSGKVNADLTAKVIRIDGEVQGDIVGKEKVIVSSSSQIKGNIYTPKMTLEEGARFKGSIDIDPEAGTRASAAGSTSYSAPSSTSGATDSSQGSGTSKDKEEDKPDNKGGRDDKA